MMDRNRISTARSSQAANSDYVQELEKNGKVDRDLEDQYQKI